MVLQVHQCVAVHVPFHDRKYHQSRAQEQENSQHDCCQWPLLVFVQIFDIIDEIYAVGEEVIGTFLLHYGRDEASVLHLM